MPRVRELKLFTLGHGNDKLGPEIPFWNLPPGPKATCPGATRICRGCCYAKDGMSREFVHSRCYERNFRFAKTLDFVPTLTAAILRENPPAFRPNDIGDFFSVPYIEKWTQICHNCPNTRFFSFSRSWRKRQLWPALQVLAAMPNMNLIISVDAASAAQLLLLPGTDHLMKAWLAEHDEDRPTCEADLIFRNNWRTLPPVPDLDCFGGMICPHQTGFKPSPSLETCFKCGYCWLWKELR